MPKARSAGDRLAPWSLRSRILRELALRKRGVALRLGYLAILLLRVKAVRGVRVSLVVVVSLEKSRGDFLKWAVCGVSFFLLGLHFD